MGCARRTRKREAGPRRNSGSAVTSDAPYGEHPSDTNSPSRAAPIAEGCACLGQEIGPEVPLGSNLQSREIVGSQAVQLVARVGLPAKLAVQVRQNAAEDEERRVLRYV